MTTLVHKNLGNGEAEAGYVLPSTGECRSGARRASDVEPGTGDGGSVRPAAFGRDDLPLVIRMVLPGVPKAWQRSGERVI